MGKNQRRRGRLLRVDDALMTVRSCVRWRLENFVTVRGIDLDLRIDDGGRIMVHVAVVSRSSISGSTILVAC
jgi:hypothetical protein